MNILLGEISSYKAIVLSKFIKKTYNDIYIYSYDYRNYTSKFHTSYSHKHVVIKKADINSYLLKISHFIEQENIDIFFPVHSDYISEILKKKYLFGNTLRYTGEYEEYYKLHEKESLQEIARNRGIKVPKNFANFDSAVVPFIGKPKVGSSAEGVIYILNEKEKEKQYYSSFENYIFQEYVAGVGCGYSVYAINGEIKTGYGHIRIAEYPASGGSSVYRAPFFKQKMRLIAKQILKEVPWTGFAMFEFKLTPDSDLVLIEVNPRIWGSINQGLQNGANYFEYIIPESEIIVRAISKNIIRTYLSPQVYLSFLFYLLKGNVYPLLTFLKNFKYNKADISFFDDPKGWMSVILRQVL